VDTPFRGHARAAATAAPRIGDLAPAAAAPCASMLLLGVAFSACAAQQLDL
jgi:hypothetical protein